MGNMAPLRSTSRFGQWMRRVWTILRLAFKKFLRIDGVQWAGAFSFQHVLLSVSFNRSFRKLLLRLLLTGIGPGK